MRHSRNAHGTLARIGILLPLRFVLLALSASLASAQALPDGRVAARGDRLLGIDVTTAQDDDFQSALDLARAAGATINGLHLNWDDLETAPGVYEPEPNYLAIANAYYPTQGTKIALTIAPIDTTNLRLPPDLAERPLDDPAVVARFLDLLDWAFAQITDLDLVSISLGNEVDVYLGAEPSRFAQYETLFEAAAAHVRSQRPGVPVGVKATWPGLVGLQREPLISLNRTSDVILVTYYPLEADFRVRDPATVAPDFAALTGIYPTRPLYFLETGYPSGGAASSVTGTPPTQSSPALQATFVREVFRAWDTHRDRIPIVKFTWLHEAPASDIAGFIQYYGVAAPGFRDYLATLGLRTRSGSGEDKPAFRVLERQARQRGF